LAFIFNLTPDSSDHGSYIRPRFSPNECGADAMVRDGVANIVHGLQQRGIDPRKVGTDSWESRCPAHGSADHALSITRDGSNHVVLECRSAQRCQYDRILHTLRLGYDTLYDETPDSLIRRLSGVPIHPALSECSQAHEKNDAGPSAVEAANVPAQTVLHPERTADADAIKSACEQAPDTSVETSVADPSLNAQSSNTLEREGPVEVLLRLASGAGFFRSADGRLFAQVPVGSRHEIYGLKSAAFRDWLIEGYFADQGEIPSPWVIRRVVTALEARARFGKGRPSVFIRVGHDGAGNSSPREDCCVGPLAEIGRAAHQRTAPRCPSASHARHIPYFREKLGTPSDRADLYESSESSVIEASGASASGPREWGATPTIKRDRPKSPIANLTLC